MNPNRLPETHGNAVTSWIPLESGLSANSECGDLRWNYWGDIIAAWDPGYGVSADQALTCHPKAVTTWWLQDRLGPNEATTVSLGPMDCPENYYTATQNVQDSSSTLIACCPSIESQGNTGQCTSHVAAGQDLTYMTRGENGGWTATTSRINTATSVVGVQINGWKFAAETAASTPSTESCSLPQSFETAPANSCSQSEAFGNSAKIGIGIGVSLGLTGLVALGAGLLMMYRARKAARSMSIPPSITKDFSNGSGPISSSQFSLSRTPEPRERSNPTEMPDSATQALPQNWSGYPAEQYPTEQPLYHSYAVTVPHGEMEGTGGPTPHTRMELEGEFERNIKVLYRPPPTPPARSTMILISLSPSHETPHPMPRNCAGDGPTHRRVRSRTEQASRMSVPTTQVTEYSAKGPTPILWTWKGVGRAPTVSIIQDREVPSLKFPFETLEDAVRVDLEADGPLDSRYVKVTETTSRIFSLISPSPIICAYRALSVFRMKRAPAAARSSQRPLSSK
ncbi:hypothetical protein DL770_005915 [Monosporascus sp. CRB-9-2]|nr:hypothetical protein DL770_005915 [Monosporascus sp. CRB-9-2]